MTEWKSARDVIDNFDERLSDIRKYGFSFITGLLSVSALFATSIPSSWKLAPLLATLSLIVSLDLVDRNYRVFQEAAAIDAQVLERRSDVNLTQTISRIYESAHVRFFFQTVYIVFTLATLLLGWFLLAGSSSSHLLLLAAITFVIYYVAFMVLYPPGQRVKATIVLVLVGTVGLVYVILHAPHLGSLLFDVWQVKAIHYHATLLVVTVAAVGAILVIEGAVDVRPWVYFGIDKYEYNPGDYVSVIVSNIGTKPMNMVFGNRCSVIDFPNIRNAITVHKEEDCKLEKPLKITEFEDFGDITIPAASEKEWRSSWSDQRWQFSTSKNKLPLGLYRVVYNGPIYGVTGISLMHFFKSTLRDPRKEKIEGYYYDRWKVAQRFVIVPRDTQPKANTKEHEGALPLKMEKALEKERKKRMLDSIPETARVIISEYLGKVASKQ